MYGRHAQPRPIGPAGCDLRERDRARAPHAAVARVDPHGPIPDGTPRQRQRRLPLARRIRDAGGNAPCSRLPHGGVRGLVRVESRHRPGARLRYVRRPLRSGSTAPVTVEPSAPRTRSRARCGRVARERAPPLLPLGPLLRPTRAVRSAAGVRAAVSRATVPRRDRDERLGARRGPARDRREVPNALRGRHRRSWREPRRARRAGARHLSLRFDASCSARHRGSERPRRASGPAAGAARRYRPDRAGVRARVAVRGRLDGVSLKPVLEGTQAATSRPSYAESAFGRLHFGWSDLRAMRDGEWKYIEAPDRELYNVRADPGERSNLLHGRTPDGPERWRRRLSAVVRSSSDAAGVAGRVASVDAERLKTLGYVSGQVDLGSAGAGRDPKAHIASTSRYVSQFTEALDALQAGQARRAERIFERLAVEFPAQFRGSPVSGTLTGSPRRARRGASKLRHRAPAEPANCDD